MSFHSIVSSLGPSLTQFHTSTKHLINQIDAYAQHTLPPSYNTSILWLQKDQGFANSFADFTCVSMKASEHNIQNDISWQGFKPNHLFEYNQTDINALSILMLTRTLLRLQTLVPIVALLVLFMNGLRIILNNTILSWVSENLVETSKVQTKFRGSCWRFMLYSFSVIFGISCVYQEPWVNFAASKDSLSPLFTGYFANFAIAPLKLPADPYYYVAFAYYIDQSILFLSDKFSRRKDALEVAIHHIATLLLLSLSFVMNHQRIGCLVLILHDASDILLELSKMLNYVDNNATGSYKKRKILKAMAGPLSVVAFVSFAALFYYTRIHVYSQLMVSIVKQVWGLGIDSKCLQLPLFVGLLMVLQILNVFWFFMIIRMIATQLFSEKQLTDARSDDEDED